MTDWLTWQGFKDALLVSLLGLFAVQVVLLWIGWRYPEILDETEDDR